MTALEGAPDLSKIKAVLFDVDGTLTDSDPLHFKAYVLKSAFVTWQRLCSVCHYRTFCEN